MNQWSGRTSELAQQAPIRIPANATVRVQAKKGYNQISYRWTENGQVFEARWHTPTPNAPAGQGNTWVVSRVTPGTPTGQLRTEHILVGNRWVPRFEWQAAITAQKNGVATPEQLRLLENGHWPAP